jgi:N-acetylglucosamine-6-phosphate deacetylase
MIVLSGADVVLPDRILRPGTVVIEGDRIIDVAERTRAAGGGADHHFDLHDCLIVPGFIDVHVHGVEGTDTLDSEAAVRTIAARLPRFGVTAFCPTSLACSPTVLRRMLASVRDARSSAPRTSARVLPAHLESNFINPDYKGAQPLECLRLPYGKVEGDFSGADILDVIAAARAEVGIVTIAPELEGAIDLIRDLASQGHHISLGHSGASYEEALAGIAAGARQATHLFNRMTPIRHRQPGLAAAVLEREEITTEVVCDAVHVHPAMVRVALAAKGPSHFMAITDGTAGSGLPRGSTTAIGGRRITVGDIASLDDGTIAGSVLTMDQAFAKLVRVLGVGLVEAATVCATTPARALGLKDSGMIAKGAIADLAVLDHDFHVKHTFVGGNLAASVEHHRTFERKGE